MPLDKENTLQLKEGRFARFEAIEWWDHKLVANARIMVIGAGALGNEVIKNLALLGVGNLVVVDMDHIEESNLSRSVLFRPEDKGKSKAECAARSAMEIYDGCRVNPVNGNVLADVGLGYFRWAQVVVGALDNREARVFINGACAQLGVPWLDGGIEVLNGIARLFMPPVTACYECTMGQVDWELINKRRSCSLLARRAMENQGVPTTPTTASVIGAVQAQEVLKLLHDMKDFAGRGFIFDGAYHNSYTTNYSINPECPWHEEPYPVEPVKDFSGDTELGAVLNWAAGRLGKVDAIDLSRELVRHLDCPLCKKRNEVLKAAVHIHEDQVICPDCNSEMVPQFFHSIRTDSTLLDKTAGQIGLPPWDILWVRRGEDCIGVELAGPDPLVNCNRKE